MFGSDENNLTLSISNFNYDDPGNVLFEYRIDNGAWMRTAQGTNFIQLNSLAYRTYTVEVRALYYGSYSDSVTYTVEIKPPFYMSMPAMMLYGLVLCVMLTYAYRRMRRRQLLRQEDEKMRFLINATHDIRTPLTLILSPLHKVMEQTADQQALQEPLQTIDRNANRILTLVNQILDLRKMDKQQMQLLCKETDMVEYIGVVCKEFEYAAKEKGIRLTFSHDMLRSLPLWIDRQNFDKVINNLVSNAMKFTPEGGEIALNLTTCSETMGKEKHVECARMTVSDNGVGIEEKDINKVFDRFYQSNDHEKTGVAGSGIGLNLCKMIVELHKGRITAQRRADGPGTVFEVLIPMGNKHLAKENIYAETEQGTETAPVHTGRSGERVLVVDDDMELARYIATELAPYYRATTCHNGREALKELLANNYDIVVTDVMMPEMDGLTLLRMIKSNVNISYIPVIVLTSKVEVANRLEGLQRGADAYLAKPFDLVELRTQIANIIANVRRMKGHFTGAQKPQNITVEADEKGQDEVLMDRIIACINENISDGDFDVDQLCSEVGISRTHLFRKMKELTGIAASEFIRNIRLEQAARLLKETDYPVSQVAYKVGFNNSSHFATLFKKHFGVTPREYAKQQDAEE